MKPICDYHMHTPLCGHAIGSPEEYVKQGIRAGLKEMGFSDHAPFVHMRDPGVTMDKTQLPEYHRMIEDVQRRYSEQITIKIALESDFILGLEKETKKIIDSFPYDYIIGSVHFIGDWAFDNPDIVKNWQGKDINLIYRQYYELLRKSAQSKMFDIMGHVDLPKKFGHRPTEDMSDEIKKTAKVFKDCGVAVEINTAGLRKPVREMYPALAALKIYCQNGVPLTFGSDAHTPQDVGADFDKAFDLARAAGYSEYLVFTKRKVEKRIKL